MKTSSEGNVSEPAPAAAPHIQRIKTALHYGGGLLGKRFAAKLAASGIKSIDAIPESKSQAMLDWLDKNINQKATT